MAKQTWKPGNMLYPLPAVLITVADQQGNPNIFLQWHGQAPSAAIPQWYQSLSVPHVIPII